MLDAHCHFWRLDRGDYGWLAGEGGPLAPLRRDFLPADYPGKGRVIAVQAAPSVAETDWLLAQAARDRRIAAVVGWVDLADAGAAATIRDRAQNPVFRGIRPMLQDIAATDWLLSAPRRDALTALADNGLCFDALVTGRHLPVLARFAAQNPALAIVIDHAAKPQDPADAEWQAGMRALAADSRIFCKVSGLLTELPRDALADPLPHLRAVFDRLLGWFGPERLIWGSDWPVLTLAAPFAQWAGLTDALLADLSGTERGGILGGNAARFYGVTA
ncbi:MAG: amidohydrolase family protein [Paracoccus sp. (in: a-proteobacteria)]|uniref:amidohydrolase family protein n=1 Tax=Paracoccus sp. TaxID=267 RepID=UPI0026E08582|nr:amidohydrolase family protein [Paracoccus sp. (in: a-proteobacteria)]MDO5614336.1 amidohydrolase family protein [Paracoccus sp. (in: a-proteobacteria)]